MAAWKVTLAIRKASDGGPAGAAGADLAAKEIDVVKTTDIRHEIVFYATGQTAERWFRAGMVLYSNAGNPAIFVLDCRDENTRGMFPNYAASDFPELLWISRSCYAGIQKIGAAACHYYAEPSGGRQAWIDQATGLPVAFASGGVVQNYLFREPPTRPLELPLPFQKALNEFSAARDLSHHEAKYN